MKKMSLIWTHMMKTINLCKQNICPWVHPGFFRGKFLLILLIYKQFLHNKLPFWIFYSLVYLVSNFE